MIANFYVIEVWGSSTSSGPFEAPNFGTARPLSVLACVLAYSKPQSEGFDNQNMSTCYISVETGGKN